MSSIFVVALALVVGQAQPQTPAAPPPQAPAPQQGAPQQPGIPQGAPQPQAQGAPAAQVITIQEALRIASERNLDLQVLKAQLAQAEEISWKAWSGYLPRVVATGALQEQRKIGPVDIGLPSGPITLQAGQVAQGQIQVSQTLLSASLIYGIRQATAGHSRC